MVINDFEIVLPGDCQLAEGWYFELFLTVGGYTQSNLSRCMHISLSDKDASMKLDVQLAKRYKDELFMSHQRGR